MLVTFHISILSGASIGQKIYSETHSVITNDFGLANLKIGMGENKSGKFSPNGWGINKHYIKVEIDVNGGNSFVLMGTSQLLSVPYAFHATTAESLTSAITETDPLFSGWDKNYHDLTDLPNIKDTVFAFSMGIKLTL